jgi:flagellar capping protein FliD
MYWKKVRNALTNLEHIRVRVENLGTFTLRANKLKKYIKNLDNKMEDVDQSSFSGYKQYEEMSERLQLLRDTMKKFETEWSERKEHYETRRKTD